ncbi:cytochrome P450 [Spirillospora sp. CA-294931]|uniref:cytochrome P450 n=1 Tax=Spirillospora sp. CA-294931 TaxID=3240042 RepID=UPI003D8F94B0
MNPRDPDRRRIAELLPFDPFSQDFLADPAPHYRRMHARGPVGRTASGTVYVNGHPECSAVLRDPNFRVGGLREFTTDRKRMAERAQAASILYMNAPRHTRIRRQIAGAFTPRAIGRLRERVHHHVDRLLTPLSGTVDLMEAFAFPLPLALVSELLGVPASDAPAFRAWTAPLARGLDPDALLDASEIAAYDAARHEAAAYFADLAGHRRRHPVDDLVSALARSPDLSERELASLCTLVLAAGYETVANLIGHGLVALLRAPAQLDELRNDPSLAASATDELLRRDGTVQATVRVARTPTEIGGVPLVRGEPVILLFAAAGHDPRVFPEPDRLDLRRPPGRHLAFGLGPHFCVGASLARLEAETAFPALVRRRPELAGPVHYREGFVLRGLTRLPVHFPAPLHVPAPRRMASAAPSTL